MAKIYVSSTYTDLKEIREQVRITLRRLGHEDVAMEYYVAEDLRPLEKCLADVERCDIYLGIFAWRYGFIPPGQDRSITELEYRQAQEKKKTCLAFLLQEQAAWPFDKIEVSAIEKIKALRKELAEEHLGGYFTSKDDIGARVAEAINNWEKSVGHEPVGRLAAWLERYALELDKEFAGGMRQGEQLGREEATKRYIEVLVRKRSKEKEVAPEAWPLSRVAEQPEARVLVLGGGGAGKTTMLRKLARDSAQRALTDPNAPLPIYVRLNFFDAQAREFEGLLEIAARAAGLTRDELYDLWHKRSRRCLFLFDGLNEVRRDFQGGCRLALQQFTQQTSHSYVITSRPGSLADEMLPELENCLVTEVVRLERNQIKEFLTSHGAADLYDRMSGRLQSLAQNPFLLWAIAQSCVGLSRHQLPANIGEIYQNLIDHYIYGIREQSKPKDSRPTQYNYELVKKPILAHLASQMCRQDATQQSEDYRLLITVQDQLRQIRAANEKEGVQILPLEPHTFMPDPPVASALLDEIVENGALQRVGGMLEFMHESVRDYFAAIKMAGWSTETIIEFIPRLTWRHIKPSYYELSLDRPIFSAMVMLSGLLADSSDLIRHLTGYHPLLAAHCIASAKSVRPEGEVELVKQWLALLDQRQPRYRWVGCQCLRVAKVAYPNVSQRLGELIRQDQNTFVRQAAARALSSLGDAEVIGDLVEEALNAAPEYKYANDTDHVFLHLRSRTAVHRLFEAWQDPKRPEARKRRAEQLMAAMDPKFVQQVLREALLQSRSCSNDALAAKVQLALDAYDSWNELGVISVTKANYIWGISLTRWSQDTHGWGQQMKSWSTEQLVAALKESEAAKRAAAADCLGARKANTVHALLEALAREQHGRVKSALFEALKAFEPLDELLSHWRALMLDSQWTLLFVVEQRLKEDLQTGQLTKRWQIEFGQRQLPLSDYPNVVQTDEGWLILPGSWSGEKYESPIYLVIPNADSLNVFDVGLRPRLTPVAGILGSAALSVLQAVIEEKNDFLDISVAKVLGEIGETDTAPLLTQLLSRENNPPVVEHAIRALGRTRPAEAVLPLIQALQGLQLQPWRPEGPDDAPASLVDTDDRRKATEGWVESWRLDSFRSSVKLIAEALEELQARDKLVLLAREAFTKSADVARFIATASLCALRETDREVQSLLECAVTDENRYVRLEAVSGLAAAKSQDGEQVLLKVCLNDTDPEVRRKAGEVLRWLPGDRAVEQLIQALRDQDHKQQIRAAEALACMEDESAIPALVEALENGPSQIRIAVCGALKASGYNELGTLAEVLISIAQQDSDKSIREEAFDALADIPGGNDKLYLPIQEALSQERFEEVIDLIGREEPFVSKDANLYWWRGCARAALTRLEGALHDLGQTAALAPEFAMGHLKRAHVLGQLGRWAEALDAARSATELEKDNSVYQTNVGWYAYQASHLQESIQASRNALELNPRVPDAAFNLGLALLAEGQWEEAAAAYRRGIENTKEIEEEPAREELESALADLKNLAAEREERAAFACWAQDLLERACAERFGLRS
jgi:HEAT repeat protein